LTQVNVKDHCLHDREPISVAGPMNKNCGDGGDGAEEAEVLALLACPRTYGLAGVRVDRIDTHAARVFLAGEHAFKIKRPVRYSYLDFSTPEARHRALTAELTLNRRTAPQIYEKVVPITRDAGGVLSLNGDGRPADWVLVMRRFDQTALLDHRAREGTLDGATIDALALAIRRLHDEAPPIDLTPGEASRRVRAVAEENLVDLAARPGLFTAADVEAYETDLRARLERESGLIEARAAKGLIRHCHGDLHLGNICLYDGRPTLFDCLEFDARLAEIDPFYDLAFLLMDLDEHGLRELANRLLGAYVREPADLEALALLPLFLSLRAAIRAKVRATAAGLTDDPDARHEREGEARVYFATARRYLAPPPALLLAVGGLSGSGKSSVARLIAPRIGPAPGALHIRSDKLRKDRFGVAETTRLPPAAYDPAVSEAVYEALFDRCARALATGHAVVADATFIRDSGRRRLEQIAAAQAVAFLGVWLEAPLDTLIERVTGRQADASDADDTVVRDQTSEDTGTITWHRLDAGNTTRALADEIKALAGQPLARAGLTEP
jgi:aminoglycoside phosphotransferase family enzyme